MISTSVHSRYQTSKVCENTCCILLRKQKQHCSSLYRITHHTPHTLVFLLEPISSKPKAKPKPKVAHSTRMLAWETYRQCIPNTRLPAFASPSFVLSKSAGKLRRGCVCFLLSCVLHRTSLFRNVGPFVFNVDVRTIALFRISGVPDTRYVFVP